MNVVKPKVKKNAAQNAAENAAENAAANKKANVQRALDIISPEEYEFIETVNDIDIKMTKEEKQQVFEEIQKRKHLAGKKTLKHKKKYTKRKTRR